MGNMLNIFNAVTVQFLVPIAHCNHSHDFSIGTVSLTCHNSLDQHSYTVIT